MSDFESSSVAYGLRQREFDDLSERTRKKLVRLMSRISEASFRRGYQHGRFQTQRGKVEVDPAILRFDKSLNQSPWAETAKGGMSADERLFCEYGVLMHLGFRESED